MSWRIIECSREMGRLIRTLTVGWIQTIQLMVIKEWNLKDESWLKAVEMRSVWRMGAVL